MSRKACVAFVDDDEALTCLVREVLQKRGWAVDTFDTAERLLASDLQSYRVILLDICLPGMWGSECAYRLREMGVHASIIAVTAHADEWDEEDLLDLGFNAVVPKPFETADLAPLVERALEGTSGGKEQA